MHWISPSTNMRNYLLLYMYLSVLINDGQGKDIINIFIHYWTIKCNYTLYLDMQLL